MPKDLPQEFDYVVTGSEGFIGRALVEKLQTENPTNRILEVDLLAPALHPDLLRKALGFNRPKVIYHLGALSHTDNDDSQAIQRWNIEYSMDLMAWCATRDVRLIYASSAATYGDGAHGFKDDLATTKKLEPISKYAISKHVVDEYFFDSYWARTNITGCKFFNVYGRPHQEQCKTKQRSMVVQFLEAAGKGLPAKLFTPGWQYRDFVWIDDVLAVLRWLEYHPVPGPLNIGTGEPWSFVEVASACYQKQKRTLDILWTDMPANLVKQYQMQTKADISKLREYGYTAPFASIAEALAHFPSLQQS